MTVSIAVPAAPMKTTIKPQETQLAEIKFKDANYTLHANEEEDEQQQQEQQQQSKEAIVLLTQ